MKTTVAWRIIALVSAAIGASALAAAVHTASAPPTTELSPDSTKETTLPAASSPQEQSKSEAMKSRRNYSKSGYDITPWTKDQVESAAKSLPADVRHIVLDAGTEPAFCGVFTDNKAEGMYVCVVGGLPLFKSEHKFTSKSGWASFYSPFDPAHVIEREDRTYGMARTEILDARTGAHLGHVFDDGPAPTGKRYCLNSAAMKFIKKGDPVPAESQPAIETAYFGGGCFWGVEDAFAHSAGVVDAESGFAGGKSATVSYKQVCNGDSGHAEVVKITFDPKLVSYRDLVKQFFRIHDPTTLNSQGPDYGEQYRSAIFTTSDEQAKVAQEIVAKLATLDAFKNKKIVTQIAPVNNYVRAEDYHQDYHAKNGGSCHMRGFQGAMPF
ncbi:MAG: bifunctional methionine sulfoxide reductase B/A protein [Phycisphaerae bacterium]|nr:bifunctional methionine sulfoxide reductase B/A protein [Phycisphaerae bacterium]